MAHKYMLYSCIINHSIFDINEQFFKQFVFIRKYAAQRVFGQFVVKTRSGVSNLNLNELRKFLKCCVEVHFFTGHILYAS